MSGEAAKERVTAVLSKSKLLVYFRFSVHPLTSCGPVMSLKWLPNGRCNGTAGVS